MTSERLKILFWNVNKKDLRDLICNAAVAVSADIVILLENKVTWSDTLNDLRSRVSPAFDCPDPIVDRFQVFSRTIGLDLSVAYAGNRISLRRLRFSGTELLLGIVHLQDKMNCDMPNQQAQVQLLAGEICRYEDSVEHNQTILIGDFNMNPFDPAMNLATGLNAMMTAKCVQKGSRVQQQQSYRFFYNPMWGLFGDRTPGPSGTYYHTAASQGMYGWNMLDQVLIRPSAIQWFDNVQILTAAGTISLQTKLGRPKKNVSDHFPILLTLKRKKNELLA
jgi:hypothetical protein